MKEKDESAFLTDPSVLKIEGQPEVIYETGVAALEAGLKYLAKEICTRKHKEHNMSAVSVKRQDGETADRLSKRFGAAMDAYREGSRLDDRYRALLESVREDYDGSAYQRAVWIVSLDGTHLDRAYLCARVQVLNENGYLTTC